MLNYFPKSIVLGTCITIIAGTCYALITDSSKLSNNNPLKVTKNIALPLQAQLSAIKTTTPPLEVIDYLVKPGENLSTIFAKLDLNHQELHKIIHANDLGKQFDAIVAGKTLWFEKTIGGKLQQLRYPKNKLETLVVKRYGENFQVEQTTKNVDIRIVSAQAYIQSSLFLDGKKVGLSDKLIMEFASIFAWEVDFALSLRAGDKFTVLFEQYFIDGEQVGTGEILVAEFVNNGRTYQAVRYKDEDGKVNYYSPKGKSLKKAFIRTPIDLARISSHFNLKRRHPVLNRIRAHKGVDYVAKTGTRIKATGKGIITYRGHKGGYGKVVIIQHGQRYSTLYAHLSKFRNRQRVGHRVEQGDIIGYVGRSGLATGPHLHYEFRVNHKHRNPLTVKLPNNAPISKSKLVEFTEQTKPLLAQFNHIKTTLVASCDLQMNVTGYTACTPK